MHKKPNTIVTASMKKKAPESKKGPVRSMNIQKADDGSFITDTEHESPEGEMGYQKPTRATHPNEKHMLKHVKSTFCPPGDDEKAEGEE